MASGNVPPLSWTCPQCGQQVPAGQTDCPNCAGAGAPPPPAPPTQPQPAPQPAPTPQPPQPPPQQPQPAADEDEGWFTRHRLLFLGGVVIVLILLVILMTRGCGGGRRTPVPPATTPPVSPAVAPAKPSPMPPAQPAVAKPAPAPATPAAPAKPLAKAPAQPARAAISRSDLQREIRKAVEEALRANQAQKGQPVEVRINPPEITVRVVREEPSSVASPQPRREKLSDRELERRFKEWLLQQEP
jgi:hypothetical protein